MSRGAAARAGRRRRRVVPALCNLAGTLILLTVVLSCIPVSVPRMLGYEIYNVVSGSMEPEIPVGSILYVEEAAPEDIREGDVIAFLSGNTVIAHRVTENRVVEGEFVTKGDANAGEDLETTPYTALIGRVARHYPYLGEWLVLYGTNAGKLYIIIFAGCGVMLNMLAGRLRAL